MDSSVTELVEPTVDADLPRPFSRIGEPGWADRARAVLVQYGVPLPEPVPEAAILERARELGVEFPPDYIVFLTELGPVDTNTLRFLPLREVKTLEDFYVRESFSERDRQQLPQMLCVVDYCGTDDPFAIHLPTGRVLRCGHDPLGYSSELASFQVLAQLAFLKLPDSYYGFPGDEIAELVNAAQRALAGREI